MNPLNNILGRAFTNAATALDLQFTLGALLSEGNGWRTYARQDPDGVKFTFLGGDNVSVAHHLAGASLDALR